MKIKKRILSLALAGVMALGLMPGMTMTALADGTTSYTITIPATLTVANSGWNATDGISATGTLESGKKLTVTAASTNNWSLKSGDNSVGYNLSTATGTYSSTAEPASWEFTELSSTVATQPMGIIVDDYSTKPAGTYTDTVTFTAKVEDAVTAPTLAGVTLTDGMIIEPHCNVQGEDNWVQFKYVAADNNFVPNFNSYGDQYSRSGGQIMQQIADMWAMDVFEDGESPHGNFYLTQSGNTIHLRADDGIDMLVVDIQLDFDEMTYQTSCKQWYKDVASSFSSIKIGDTTITASQMTVQ